VWNTTQLSFRVFRGSAGSVASLNCAMLNPMRKSGMVCIALCIGYLIGGLWPFNFIPHNRAQWSSDGAGLHFEPLAFAKSSAPISLNASSFTIEMLVSIETEAEGDTRSLFSIYNGASHENLSAVQWKDAFLLRIPLTDSKGRRKTREIGVDNVLRPGQRRFLAAASGTRGTSLYVEGKLAKNYPRVVLRPGSVRGELIIGDTPEKGAAFTGTLFGLALFNRTLGPAEVARHDLLWKTGRAGEIAAEPELAGLYLFNRVGETSVADLSPLERTLAIPEYFRALHRRLAILAWENWIGPHRNVQDVVINILGFVPFGFFYYIWRRGAGKGRVSGFAAAVLASAVVSAAIELAQVFLPTRSSSMRDLICNIAGGAAGAIVALLIKNATERTE
jgi:hypothetical protein